MNLSDVRKNEIAYKRRFCFGSDGVERLSRVIADRQVGKACGGAEDWRVKSAGPKVSLRAVNADRENPVNRF